MLVSWRILYSAQIDENKAKIGLVVTYLVKISNGLHAERKHLDGLLWQGVQLPINLPHASVFVAQVRVRSGEHLQLAALQEVRQSHDLLHELLQVEGPLLKELDVFRVSEEAALGELGDVKAAHPSRETLPQGLELGESTLDFEVTLRIESFHCVKYLSIPLNRVANEDVFQPFVIWSEHCRVEHDTIVVANLAIFGAILQLFDQLLLVWCLRLCRFVTNHETSCANTRIVDVLLLLFLW